jgi:hypothetical protein
MKLVTMIFNLVVASQGRTGSPFWGTLICVVVSDEL